MTRDANDIVRAGGVAALREAWDQAPVLKFEPKPKDDPAATELQVWGAGTDDADIPPRQWLLGNTFCRGFGSEAMGPGGSGKTAVRHLQYIALSTGRELSGEHVFQRCRVLIVSLEDGRDELRRRIRAACQYHGVDRAELQGWLFLSAPGGKAGKLLEMDRDGNFKTGNLAAALRAEIVRNKIDLVALDPFKKTHGLPENDNTALDAVAQVLTDMGDEYNIAVDIVHHVRKGPPDPGNADSGRGGGSIKDAMRLVYTVTTMTPDEANRFDIPESERKSYVRLDDGKVNIVRSGQTTWFRLVSVALGNGTADYPNGDHVQTVERWTPPNIWEDMPAELVNRILTDIDAGLPNGSRYSASASAKPPRAAWQIVNKHATHKSEKAAREIVSTWTKTGLLIEAKYHDPERRKELLGVSVDWTKKPGVRCAP